MLDFGEELTIDTLKIPWLIWIQILVLLLLLILLYCFSILSLDLSHNTTSSSSASPSSSGPCLLIKRSSQPSQIGGSQSIKGKISTGIIRRVEEVLTERESASASASSTRSSSINYHPCHYFKLARLAFIKCLGLDSESQNSSNSHEQRKE